MLIAQGIRVSAGNQLTLRINVGFTHRSRLRIE